MTGLRATPEGSLFSFACIVKETSTHTVYVHAANAAEAREKAKDAGNWYDDASDFTEAAPIVVRSVKRDKL